MLLDGAHLVSDAIAAGVTFQLAAVTPASHEAPDIRALVAALRRHAVDTITVSASVMDAVSPVKTPSGIVALAERPAFDMAMIYGSAAALVVCAVDVQDPGNLGAIIRVSEAAGATGLIACGDSAYPFSWKALRGSMGSALRLPIVTDVTAGDAVADAKRHGCRIVATVARDGASLFDTDLSGRLQILIGGEGRGLPLAITAAADTRVTIPMQAPVESLNAAVTAALIVYEAGRQQAAAKTRKHAIETA
jgi:RNA methyltransferase, TrmH family